jgi:hypothetical protein
VSELYRLQTQRLLRIIGDGVAPDLETLTMEYSARQFRVVGGQEMDMPVTHILAADNLDDALDEARNLPRAQDVNLTKVSDEVLVRRTLRFDFDD